jgi:acyl-coenzyme A thioesterase PaaI-like protein
MTGPAIPPGFRRIDFAAPSLLAAMGPFYLRADDDGGLTVGMRVEARHSNSSTHAHGGLLLTLADMSTGMVVSWHHGEYTAMPTVSQTSDFVGAAPIGAWVESKPRIVRLTRSLAFLDTMITADGAPALRASTVYKLGPKKIPSARERYEQGVVP